MASNLANNSMQVIDYLDAYSSLCDKRNTFVVSSIKRDLEHAIDGGNLPDTFDLSGNTTELRYTRVNDDYLDILLTPMRGIDFLRKLNLSYNNIGDQGATNLAHFLKDDKYLVWINLRANEIKSQGGVALAKALQINLTLTELDIGDNGIGDFAGLEFAGTLQVNTAIHRLHIDGCDLRATSFISLFTVLQNNNTCSFLNISNNLCHSASLTQTVQNDIMIHMSKMLRLNHTISRLGLKKFGITDWAMVDTFANTIMNNSTLVILDLCSNKITRDGSVALCRALYGHPSIRTLKLSCNCIQNEGAEAVSNMLLNNTCLVNLYLDHNAINGKGLVLLAEGLARNTTLQFLTLWGNEWSTEACDAFARLVGGSVSNCCIGSTDSKPIPGQKQLLEKIGSAFGNRVGIFRAVQPRARANNRVGALTLGSTESRGTSAVSSLSSRSNAGSRAAQPETAKGEDVEQPADTRPPRFKDGQIDVVFYGIEGVTFAAHYPIPDVV